MRVCVGPGKRKSRAGDKNSLLAQPLKRLKRRLLESELGHGNRSLLRSMRGRDSIRGEGVRRTRRKRRTE